MRRLELLEALAAHECTTQCENIFYVFKELPRSKFSRPWDITASMRVNSTSSAQVNSVQTTCEASDQDPGCAERSTNLSTIAETASRNETITSDTLGVNYGGAATEEMPNMSDAFQPSSEPLSHLEPTSKKLILQTMKKWQKDMNLNKFVRDICAVCSESKVKSQIRRKHVKEVNLKLLQNDDLPEELLPVSYNMEYYDRAILEPRGLEDVGKPGYMNICKSCLRELSKGKMPRLALANWLYYAHERLPPDISKAFMELSVFEKALICRVRTNSIMCRFYGLQMNEEDPYRQGSRHIKGNVVSTPLNVPRLNNLLPPSPSAIKDTICTLFVSKSPPTRENINKMKPVLVRKSRIKSLIQFLINKNPHYHASTGFRGYSSENLEALFDDDADVGVPSAAQVGFLPMNEAVDAIGADYDGRTRGLNGLFMENTSFTTGDGSARSYRDMCMEALNWCKGGRPFVSTRSGSNPVPDIGNPNWLSWAHPNADPYGIGGFNDPRRKRPISPEVQLQHLLNVVNPLFECDHELAFDVYNILRKSMVNSSLRFVVPVSRYRRLIEEIKRLDGSKIEDLILKFKLNPTYQPRTDEEQRIARLTTAISPIARGIPGGAAQRIKMRNEIRGIINQRGSPTLFITLNPADQHNPLVAVLAMKENTEEAMNNILGMTANERMRTSLRHPAACARFFDIMIKSFISIILKADKKGAKKGIFGHCESYYGTVETQGRGALHCHMLVWLRGHLPPETLAETLKSSPAYRDALTKWMDSIMDSGFNGVRSYLNGVDTQDEDELIKEHAVHPGSTTGPEINTTPKGRVKTEVTEHTDDLLLRYNWHKHTDFKFIGTGEDAKAFLYYVTDYITKAPLSMYAGLSALSYAIRMYSRKGLSNIPELDDEQARQAMTIAVNSMLGHQEFSHPQVMSFLLGLGESYTCETFHSVNWSEILIFVSSQTSTPTNLSRDSEPASRDLPKTQDPMANLKLSVAPSKTGVSASNQLLDYIYRPTTEPFASMGLYKHLAWTIRVTKSNVSNPKKTGDEFSSPSHPQYSTHRLKVRTNPAVPVLLGPSLKRKNGSEAEQEEWAKEMVILFKPWRDPKDLKDDNETWSQALKKLEGRLESWDNQVIRNLSILPEAKQARDQRPRRRAAERFKNSLYTIDMDTVQEETNDGPFTEGNVYELVAEEDNIIETDAHLTMEKLLRDDTTKMFERCIREDQPNSPSTPTNSDDLPRMDCLYDDADSIHQQKKYMAAQKFRKLESPNDAADTTTQENRVVRPDVKVDTVHEIQKELEQEGCSSPWKIVSKLVDKQNLKGNPEQLKAFGIIANQIIEGDGQLLMYVGGEGGTGKSYLINTIVMLFKLLNLENTLRLGALTGIAASLIGGQTLHSLLSINTSKKRSGITKRLVNEWKGVKYLVIDEVSMIGAQFLAKISTRIRHAKGDDKLEAGMPFGGVNVIFMGDFLQLTPPKQPSLFSHQIIQNPSFVEAKNADGLNSMSGVFLWRQVNRVVILRKNKRQQNDATLAKILAKMRSDSEDQDNIASSRIGDAPLLDHLYKRELSSVFNQNRIELRTFQDATVIVGNKTIRDALNIKLIAAHAHRLNQRIHLYHSTDSIAKDELPSNVSDILRRLPARVTKDHLGKLPMFIGMKVMITENVSVPFKIVNGSEGTIHGIRFKTDDEGRRRAEVVYVAIENCAICAPNLPKGVVPVFERAVHIKFSVKGQNFASDSFKRMQIPLVPSYAITDYKSQGRTLDRAIIDLASSRGQGSYVMMSRTLTLKGILILRWFPANKITQRKSQELRNELARLKVLDEETKRYWELNIKPKLIQQQEPEGEETDGE